MFSANAMSSLPISDDGKKPRTFLGSVKIFFNQATLTFTLNINRVANFPLAINLVSSMALTLNMVQHFALRINKNISKALRINKIIDFSRRR